ncbi:MAG: WcaF family extracellular polysaccharide biosynthesis acetyltransferase [Bacteroidota bacterium]
MNNIKQTDLSTYDNKSYQPGKNGLIKILWYFTNVLFFINPLNPISSLKIFLLRVFGAKVGKGVVIKPSVNIKYPWRLKIGNHSWIGEKVWIDNLADVEIGDNCCLSQAAMLLCGNHNYKNPTFDLITGKIILENGVWIGANATVTPRVICGSHMVLTVNSVLTQDAEPYRIYSGNPAIPVKFREIS